MNDKRAIADAEVLWNYMTLHENPVSADILLVLGSIDERVAMHAAKLSKEYNYGHVIFTGGIAHSGDLLRTDWNENEALHFYEIFKNAGGNAAEALLETTAQNTGQNATLSYELLIRKGIGLPKTMVIVTKPYMERRARATFEVQWPDVLTRFFVTSPPIPFRDYPCPTQPLETLINILVGDFQRLIVYAERGLQSKQEIPIGAMESWKHLVEKGYTKHLLN